MSRSFKKHGIIKDKGIPRPIYNRRLRRVNKQRVQEGKKPFLLKELIDEYDVCDFILSWTPPIDYVEPLDEESARRLIRTRRRYFGK